MVKYLSLKNSFYSPTVTLNIQKLHVTSSERKKKCHRLQMRSSIVTIINNLREKKKNVKGLIAVCQKFTPLVESGIIHNNMPKEDARILQLLPITPPLCIRINIFLSRLFQVLYREDNGD